MCVAASSCHPVQQGEGAPAVSLHDWLSVTDTEVQHGAKWLSCMLWQPVELFFYALTEYDRGRFYSSLCSLLARARMTVFTAHKWNGVHISYMIRRTVRRHTLRTRCTLLKLGHLALSKPHEQASQRDVNSYVENISTCYQEVRGEDIFSDTASEEKAALFSVGTLRSWTQSCHPDHCFTAYCYFSLHNQSMVTFSRV